MLISNTPILLLLPLTLAFSSHPSHPRSHAHSRLTSLPSNSLGLRHNADHHEARRRGEGEWLVREKGRLRGKYDEGLEKRAQGSLTLANQDKDASYSATIAVGSTSQTFEVALDTGSADLWLLSTECSLPTCNGLDKFDPLSSTTYRNGSTQFSIAYGSGSAQGHLGSDTVTLGGFSVQGQTFGVVSSMSSGLVDTPLSGLMGLGFKSLAVTGATPWWQSLATSGAWTDPVFGFYMKRYRDVSTASSTEPDGGEVTLGYVDAALYEGDVEWVPVDEGKQSYWNIPIAGLSMQGTTVQVTATAAAIDTGTTLIGGPETDVAALYAAIPGSRKMTGSYAGYYEYPCSTAIDMTMTFGSHVVTINENDFNIGSYSSDSSYCTGGVYVQGLSSSSAVQWVVGDTMLKNVYSLYRYSPAAVGFASLPGSGASSSSSSTSAASSSSSIASTVTSSPSGSTLASSSSGSSSSSASSSSVSSSSSSSSTTSSAAVVVVTATATADLTGSAILQSTLVGGGGGAGDATATLATPAASTTTSTGSAKSVRLPHILGSLGLALAITLTLF